MRVLGIDPGSRACGYGIVEEPRSGSKLIFIECGVISMPAKSTLPDKLGRIYNEMAEVIKRTSPDEAAVENVFFASNARSALMLGHARAAAMLAAIHFSLAVHEYTPLQIKKAVVGYGGAEKNQVGAMMKMLLNLPKKFPNDATDALACAVCHINSYRFTRKVLETIK